MLRRRLEYDTSTECKRLVAFLSTTAITILKANQPIRKWIVGEQAPTLAVTVQVRDLEDRPSGQILVWSIDDCSVERPGENPSLVGCS